MKKFICQFIVLSIACYGSDLKHEEFEKIVEDLMCLMEIPGAAVGIVVDGKTFMSKGFGLRNIEKNLPVTPKTIFPAGSSSKALTAFMIGQLVDEERLAWDDPISDHIPYFKLQDPFTTYNITIRDYLTHTSGYPRHDAIWYNHSHSRSEIIRRLKYLDPLFDLREKFYYQNVGYMVASHAAELVMKKSYEDLIEERIFKPLGMRHSNFSIHTMQNSDNYALSYDNSYKPVTLVDPKTIAAAGGLNSNIEDLLKWIKLLLKQGEGLIEPSTFSELIKPQVVSDLICNPEFGVQDFVPMEAYGFGWILLSYRGHFVALHGGIVSGFTSVLLFLPNDNVGMIILGNKSGSPFPFLAAGLMMDKLLDLPFIDWAKRYSDLKDLNPCKEISDTEFNSSPSHPISDYLGTYLHPGYGTIEVRMQKDTLYAIFNNLHLPLRHCNYNVFEVSNLSSLPVLKGLKFTFEENYLGNIHSIRVPFEPKLDGISFKKLKDPLLTGEDYLEKFTGDFSYLGFTISITRIGSALVAKAFGQPPFELCPELPNLFNVKDHQGSIVEFLLNDSEEITGVKLTRPDNSFYIAHKK